MGLIQKLNEIKTIKDDIKDAIVEKGGVLEDTTPFSSYAGEIRGIQTGEEFEIDNVKSLFSNGYRDSCIDVLLKHINFSKISDMNYMFGNCKDLKSLDLSNFDTSNVTIMKEMFYYCENLTSLDLSSFDTSKVTNMYGMFENCKKLVDINLSSFNTSNVTNMSYMFDDCSFKSIDLSNFNTSNVTNMSFMFENNYKLESIDLSNFDTSKVTDMRGMFHWCFDLKTIIGLNISNVTDMMYMFSNSTSITTIDFTGTTDVKCNFDVSPTGLTRDGLMNMLSTLPTLDHTQTITIGTSKMNKLSDEDISEFTTKGYTLA